MTAEPDSKDATSNAEFDFVARLRQIPDQPGVYLMKDRQGRVIYIGKAARLQTRLRQYQSRQDERFFVDLLGHVLGAIEVVRTPTEKDALLLENQLIKRHQPRFNVQLKDDKRFIHLRLGDEHNYPRLEVVRRPKDDGARYFGPYTSASSARATLRQVNRHFQLRTCSDVVFRNRSRPCLEHQIKRCLAPCVLPVSAAVYDEHITDVALFLDGRGGELIPELKGRMQAAAAAEDFERAATLRDQWRAIEGSLEPQHVALTDHVDRDLDAIGLYREGSRVAIAVLTFRGGSLVARLGFALEEQEFADVEVLSGFVERFYDGGASIPDEVLVSSPVEGVEVLSAWLGDLRKAAGG